MLNKGNNKSTKILQKQLPLLAIIIVAIGIYFAQKYQSSAFSGSNLTNGIGNSCNFVNKTCEFLIDEQLAIARFSVQPLPEESTTLSIALPEDIKIQSAWIEGVNMYMGKIPVLLDFNGKGAWTGWFMLGSCSEPVMKWQLRLNIEGEEAPTYLYFVTEQQ